MAASWSLKILWPLLLVHSLVYKVQLTITDPVSSLSTPFLPPPCHPLPIYICNRTKYSAASRLQQHVKFVGFGAEPVAASWNLKLLWLYSWCMC